MNEGRGTSDSIQGLYYGPISDLLYKSNESETLNREPQEYGRNSIGA